MHGCYYVMVDKLQQVAANYRCYSLHPDAHLVAITSVLEQSAIAALLFRYPGEYSIRPGLHCSKQFKLYVANVV